MGRSLMSGVRYVHCAHYVSALGDSTDAHNAQLIVLHTQTDYAREETRFGYYSAFTLRNVCTNSRDIFYHPAICSSSEFDR